MPGGRPPKTLSLVTGHRTKAEIQIRKEAEAKLLTGTSLKENEEVKKNPIAHKEFMRIKKLLRSINKDDDLSGNIINSHCLLVAECKEIEEVKNQFIKTLKNFESRIGDEEISFSSEIKFRMGLQSQILGCDKALMAKRKMILDISKENVMTIQSAMRSIPKKEQPKEKSAMTKLLEKRTGGNA